MVMIIGLIARGAKRLFGGAKKPTRESISQGLDTMVGRQQKQATASQAEAKRDVSAPLRHGGIRRRARPAVKRAIEANRRRRAPGGGR